MEQQRKEMTRGFKEWSGFFKPLKSRNVRIFWSGQTCSLIGMWLQVTAMGILVYSYSNGSAGAVGVLSALNAAPFLLGGMFLGSLGDRFDRRHLLLVVQIVQIVLAALLCALSWSGNLVLWHLYAAGLVMGILQSLAFPTLQAFVGDLVPKKLLTESVGMYSLVFNLCRSIGPPLGGFALIHFGAAFSFGINAVCALPLVGSLLLLRGRVRGERKKLSVEKGGMDDSGISAISSLRVVMKDRRLLFVLASALVQNIFVQSLYQIVPALTDGNAKSTGLVLGAIGAGALVSILFVLPFVRGNSRVGLKLSVGTLWMGLVIMISGIFPVLPVQQVCFFLCGLATSALFVTTSSTVQVLAPSERKTAILGILTMVTIGTQPMAALVWGALIDLSGVSFTVIFVGAAQTCLSVLFLSVPFWRRWKIQST